MKEPVIPEGEKRLGDYEIIHEIGRGGMGTVYEARQLSLNRRVALKVLWSGLGLTSSSVTRFRREAEAAGMVHHTNIVPIYTIGESRGTYFYAMELVEGLSLKQAIRYLRLQHGKEEAKQADTNDATTDYGDIPKWAQETMAFADGSTTDVSKEPSSETGLGADSRYFETVARMTADVAAALEHAHRRGIIHRDVKPSNLLLSSDGRLSLSDFGLARILDKPGMTITGECVGTPLYMSPEQVAAGRVHVDHRTDIYSLGVTLYELLTLTPAFAGRNREQIMAQILQKDILPPRRVNRRVPVDLDTICMKAVERDPDRRYQTAEEMENDLRRFVNGDLIKAKRPSAAKRALRIVRKHKARFVTAAVITLLIVIAAGFGYSLYWERQRAKARENLPRIEELFKEGRTVAAFSLAKETETIIPKDKQLAKLWKHIAVMASINTQPTEVLVEAKDWRFPQNPYVAIGVTPLLEERLPRGMVRWQFSKEGYVSVERLTDLEKDAHTNVGFRDQPEIAVQLDNKTEGHDGMVRVLKLEGPNQRESTEDSYFIDKYEVTNKEYYQFIQLGGYENRELWQSLINDLGESGWENTRKEFVDATGVYGPSTWSHGNYQEGEGDFPVRGVSWYEAMAYAVFVEKSLPTQRHWRRAATLNYATWIIPLSNFDQQAVARTGENPGIGYFGIYDMAGNVREWCWNTVGEEQRCTMGGYWNGPTYQFTQKDAAFPTDRPPNVGFRCVLYKSDPSPEDLAPIQIQFGRDYTHATAASQSDIDSFRNLYLYDKEEDLEPEKISEEVSPNNHRYEICEVNSAISDKTERLPLHILFPSGQKPPYRTAIYFPGTGALWPDKLANIQGRCDWVVFESFVDHGIAMCWPVYKGTLDRRDERIPFGNSIRNRDSFVDMAKDLFRAIDYLETRDEIDISTLSYVGFSWGGCHGPVISVLEPRIKSLVLISSGCHGGLLAPEVDPFNYLPWTNVPVLVLNGQYDQVFPVNESQLPFFANLGSTDKERMPYDTSHFVPLEKAIPYACEWLQNRQKPETGGTD